MITISTLSKLVVENPLSYLAQFSFKPAYRPIENGIADKSYLRQEIVAQYCQYFNSMGYAVQLKSASHKKANNTAQQHYAVELSLQKNAPCFVCISITNDVLLKMTQPLQAQLAISQGRDEAYELFAQLLHNLNFSVCRKINSTGFCLKHGAVQFCLPWINESTPEYSPGNICCFFLKEFL